MTVTNPPLIDAAGKTLDPATRAALGQLRPGQRLRVTQRVKVGLKVWTTTVTGVFRNVSSLVTGLATQRVPADEIIVPTVHFTKDNGELTSVALDEFSKVEIVS
jgi:hypothetical protein